MPKTKLSYFVTGGGTGGHIYPAIAVADELLTRETTGKIFYVGNPNNMEADIVSGKSYEFLPVVSSGMPRKLGFPLVKWMWQMFAATLKCCGYIDKYKPDVIFGTGGYVSAPVLIAGRLKRVPYVLHDCDVMPGLVTRKFAKSAKSVSVAFPGAKKKLGFDESSQKVLVNGNPIRSEFKTLTKTQARELLGLGDKLTLCIMGGSQGAKTINSAAVEILKILSTELNLQVIFQTGKKKFEEVESRLREVYPEYETDKNLIVRPYFDNMTEVLKASDIAVSRAGSLSISEICACKIAAFYVPYPYAAANHQYKNAKFMVDNEAALLISDDELTPQVLLAGLKDLLTNPEKLENLQQKAYRFAKPDAVYSIVEQINEGLLG
ncbi:MAG: undecaprenyldiphospho-muramoylpentapeptide beta-N-acetylglucosaminyltransferase [Muribaculaceae bacterium]|nr:undecaprenyldiphospho-muramoylpentapeptide beta-N-acetylglucosaminyltransferase [Muribaculaceae bacterium]